MSREDAKRCVESPGRPIRDLATMRKLEANAQDLAREVAARTPNGWGFVVLQFEFDEGGGCVWVANGARADVLDAVDEWVARIRAGQTGSYRRPEG